MARYLHWHQKLPVSFFFVSIENRKFISLLATLMAQMVLVIVCSSDQLRFMIQVNEMDKSEILK